MDVTLSAYDAVMALELDTAKDADTTLFDPKGPNTFDPVTNEAVSANELVTALELDTAKDELIAKELVTALEEETANDELSAYELDTANDELSAYELDSAYDELTTFCIDDVAIGTATPVESPTQVNPCCIFGTSL